MARHQRIIRIDVQNHECTRREGKPPAAFYAVWGILWITALWMMSGCSHTGTLTEEQFIYRFALYVDVPKSDYWDQIEKGMNRAFETIQFELEKKYSVQEDREAMNAALRSGTSHLRACAVALHGDKAAEQTILNTMQAGVPVICVGNDLKRSVRTGAVLTNYYEAGRKAGRYYAQSLRRGTVVLLGTLPVPNTREEVWEGVRHGLAVNRRISLKIVRAEQPVEIRLQLQQALVNPQVSGVFLLGAETIESGYATIQNIGVRHPLVIGGLSHYRTHQDLVTIGAFGLMIVENPEEIGYRAGRLMRDAGTGRGGLNVQIFVPFEVYRKRQG